jgi:hypothetical protein
MTGHEEFEVLCMLAATGQLSPGERVEFYGHCVDCPACREQLEDLVCIGMQLQLDAAIRATGHANGAAMPAGSLGRFRARAIREGITLLPASPRPSFWYAMGPAAAVLAVVAVFFMPHERRAGEPFATSTVATISSRQNLTAAATGQTLIPRRTKIVHARVVRHGRLAHAEVGAEEAGVTDERFPHAITAVYPFFGTQSITKSSVNEYPTLSQSQIDCLNLFRNGDRAKDVGGAGIAMTKRPIDIASTGSVFDFTSNIRQLHFQLSTAQ